VTRETPYYTLQNRAYQAFVRFCENLVRQPDVRTQRLIAANLEPITLLQPARAITIAIVDVVVDVAAAGCSRKTEGLGNEGEVTCTRHNGSDWCLPHFANQTSITFHLRPIRPPPSHDVYEVERSRQLKHVAA